MLQLNKLVLSALAISGSLLSGAQADIVKTSSVANMCRKPGDFAFTFDGGASIYTGHVLDALAERKAKATFHPVVTYLQDVTVVANIQRAAMDGHLIGLFIEQSLDLTKLSDEDILSSINSRAEVLASVTGYKPKFIRIHNYQDLSEAQIKMIHAAGYQITTYNLDSYDYNTPDCINSFKKILDLLSTNTKGAFISVQRDYVPESTQSAGAIFDYVLSKGYRLVTLEECLGVNAGKPSNVTVPKFNGDGPKVSAASTSDATPAHALSASSLTLMTVFSAVVAGSLFMLA